MLYDLHNPIAGGDVKKKRHEIQMGLAKVAGATRNKKPGSYLPNIAEVCAAGKRMAQKIQRETKELLKHKRHLSAKQREEKKRYTQPIA